MTHAFEIWKAIFVSSLILLGVTFITAWVACVIQEYKKEGNSAAFLIGFVGLFIALTWVTDRFSWLIFTPIPVGPTPKPVSTFEKVIMSSLLASVIGILSSFMAFFIINNNF